MKIFAVVWWVLTCFCVTNTFIAFAIEQSHHVILLDYFTLGFTIGTALLGGFRQFMENYK